MFFGSSFYGDNLSTSNSSAKIADIPTLVIKNVVIDELYATKNVLVNFDWKIPTEWDYNTHLHATYKGDTYAGNIAYSKNIVSSVKIKKRFKGDFTWKTIYEKKIESEDDFFIDMYDYLEPSDRDIEYAYVSVIQNKDTDVTFAEVHSEFDNYFLVGQNEVYPLILNQKNEIQYNRESNVIVSPGSKYPYVVNNGIARYYSGTLTVTFIEFIDDCILDLKNGWKYRNQIDQFLTDGKAKILKSFEGDMWMINVVGNIPRTENGFYQNISQQIDWVECGDPLMAGDLYDNGFINSDADRE